MSRLVASYLEHAGLWGWTTIVCLGLAIMATGLALWGRGVSRSATVLAVTAGTLAVLSAIAPLGAERSRIVAGATGRPDATLFDAIAAHNVLLFGGGMIAVAVGILGLFAIVRRGPDAGRSVGLLFVPVVVVPGTLGAKIGLGIEAAHGRRDLLDTTIYAEDGGFAVAGAALALLIGGILVAFRVRASSAPLSVPARLLACALAVLGPAAFLASRPLAYDTRHLVPPSNVVVWTYVGTPPSAQSCHVSRDPSPALHLGRLPGEVEVELDGRPVEPERMLSDLDSMARNWGILHPGSEFPLTVALLLRSDDDPRHMRPHLHALRRRGGYTLRMAVRRYRNVQTATLGEVERYDACLLDLAFAHEGAVGRDVIPLERVTDGQTLARLIEGGGRRLAL